MNKTSSELQYKSENYILWIGSIYAFEDAKYNSAISHAASIWQSGLINALQQSDQEVVLISPYFQQLWPFGPFFCNSRTLSSGNFLSIWCEYWNIPYLKSKSIVWSMRDKITEYFKENGLPKAIISYNPTKENVETGLYFQKKVNVPWIDLCADSNDPGSAWSNYAKGAEFAAGHIFLSYYAFQSCPFQNKFHLDGGVTPFSSERLTFCNDGTLVIFYSGMLGPWGGVDALINCFEKLTVQKVQLWICGHGNMSQTLRTAILRDSRIVFHGLVSDDVLDKLSQRVDIFVNPRPTRINGGGMNFPSKLLRYLTYEKPIISSMTAGLNPNYKDVLIFPADDTELSLMQTIESVIRWDETQLKLYAGVVRQFCLDKGDWDKQASRLLAWISEF
jgi:glycosyltransferase involved in cell wall biosynthesis